MDVAAVAADAAAGMRDVIIVQTGGLPQVRLPGMAAGTLTPNFLFLSATIFEETHAAALQKLDRHEIPPSAEALKVDKLVSVPLKHLIEVAKGLPANSKPGPVQVRDKKGEVVALHPAFSAALTHKRVVDALEKGLASLLALGVLPVAGGGGGSGGAAAAPVQHLPPSGPQPPLLQPGEDGDMDLIVTLPSRASRTPFRLFIGSFGAAHNRDFLMEQGVTHIVNCAAADMTPDLQYARVHMELNDLPAGALARCCSGAAMMYQPADLAKPTHWAPFAHNFEYAAVFAQENGSPCQDITVGWPGAFSLLRECWREGGTALIHCKAGLNRSVTTAAVFLVLHGVCATWDDAITLIRKQRPAVNYGNEDPYTHTRIPAPHRHWYELFGASFIERNAAKPVRACCFLWQSYSLCPLPFLPFYLLNARRCTRRQSSGYN